MKQKLSPLEILEFISLAGTAAGTASVVLLSQHVGYAIAPGAVSLVLGAANRRLSHSGANHSTELVQVDQKLAADLASVRQQVQGLPSSSDYNSLKSSLQDLSSSFKGLEQQPDRLKPVGVELNPIRQDIVQLRSQYGNVQDFLAQLRDRVETFPSPNKLQTLEDEVKQMEMKLAQLPAKFQKMSDRGSGDLTAITSEIEALKTELKTIASANDLNLVTPELEVLKRQVTALETTSDRLVVESQNLADKQEMRSLLNAVNLLQTQQRDFQEATETDRRERTEMRDRLEDLHQELTAVVEQTPANADELEKLQSRFQQLKEKVDLRIAVASVEIKDGQTLELTGVEEVLAKIAGAVSEMKFELDHRMESIESVELRTIHAQLLDQQQTLTGLQTEYQRLLASIADRDRWVGSLPESDYHQKIESLERALATTTESIDRIESSLMTNGSNGHETVAIDPDLSILVPEIEQIGWLNNTVSQLAVNLDRLERHVQFALDGRAETIPDEVREELQSLKESLNRVENSLNHSEVQDNIEAYLPELKILSQELQQIGMLQETIDRLFGNVEILDRQVYDLATGRSNSMTGQLKEELDRLTGKVEQMPELSSRDLTNAYDTVMLRLEQVESTCVSLEDRICQDLELTHRSDCEINDQLYTLNNQWFDIHQQLTDIGRKITDLEQGQESISRSELHETRQDVSILQTTLFDLVERVQDQFDQTTVQEKIQELAVALSTLENKLSISITQLDDEFTQLQLQTAQLAAEQAHSSEETSQIEALIGNSIDRQMGGISQLLQDVSACEYELVFDRPAIQDCIATAIDNSKKRLIVVCPWLNRETMSPLLDKLEEFLQRNGHLQIGWGHLADIDRGEFPLLIHQQWHMEPLTKRSKSYDALNEIEALRQKYPDRVEYKVLGTHENFLVSDNKLAIISSHHFLNGATDFPEREVAIETTSMKIIHGLIDRFKDPGLKPGNADAYYNRGFERLEIGDYLGAMEDYTRALDINPDRPSNYNNLGLAKYHGGNVPGAIADYTKAIELDPDEPVTYFNRAVAYYKMGRYRKSIADYTQVIQRQDGIRISVENTGAYFQRAEAYRQLGEYDSAICDYTMAIRLAPNDAVAYNNRGLARYNYGDYLGSIHDYTEALNLKPEDAVAYSNRGVSRLKSGDYAGAVADFDCAIALKDNYASAYNNRGLARCEMGDRSGAIADLEKAAELFAASGNVANQQQALDSIKRLGDRTP